jgi:hypothetical protein
MEQQLAAMGRLLEGREFDSQEDVNAFLQAALLQHGGRFPSAAPQTPLERAVGP